MPLGCVLVVGEKPLTKTISHTHTHTHLAVAGATFDSKAHVGPPAIHAACDGSPGAIRAGAALPVPVKSISSCSNNNKPCGAGAAAGYSSLCKRCSMCRGDKSAQQQQQQQEMQKVRAPTTPFLMPTPTTIHDPGPPAVPSSTSSLPCKAAAQSTQPSEHTGLLGQVRVLNDGAHTPTQCDTVSCVTSP